MNRSPAKGLSSTNSTELLHEAALLYWKLFFSHLFSWLIFQLTKALAVKSCANPFQFLADQSSPQAPCSIARMQRLIVSRDEQL